MKKTLDEAEALATMASINNVASVDGESPSLRVYGGSASSGTVAKKRESSRDKLLRQVASLDEQAWVSVMGHVNKFCDAIPVSKKNGNRGASAKAKNKLSRLVENIKTVLSEHVGNTKGGVNAVLNMKAFEEAMAMDLTASDLEMARTAHSEPILEAVTKSIGDVIDAKKARAATMKPNVPGAYSPTSFAASLPSSDGFLEYEQPLGTWEHDSSMVPDLDGVLNVTPLKKTSPYKFVLVAVDSQATESDVRTAVTEACDQSEVHITDIEFFNDLVANKQRRHAFVSVNSLSQLQSILNDRVRAFGVHINGQRSSIIDVEEKNIISIMTRPPIDAERIETMLKDLGIMTMITKDSAAPSQPLVSSYHLNSPRPNRFSIFAPRDGNGDLIGKAWISFPSHASAYAAYNSLIQARPGSIRAFWSQKSPNHFEEAIRLRDLLAAENAELRQKVSHLSANSDDDSDAPGTGDQLSLDSVIANHVLRVLNSARGDTSQAAQLLNISERALHTHVKKLRASGLDVPSQDKARL